MFPALHVCCLIPLKVRWSLSLVFCFGSPFFASLFLVFSFTLLPPHPGLLGHVAPSVRHGRGFHFDLFSSLFSLLVAGFSGLHACTILMPLFLFLFFFFFHV